MAATSRQFYKKMTKSRVQGFLFRSAFLSQHVKVSQYLLDTTNFPFYLGHHHLHSNKLKFLFRPFRLHITLSGPPLFSAYVSLLHSSIISLWLKGTVHVPAKRTVYCSIPKTYYTSKHRYDIKVKTTSMRK